MNSIFLAIIVFMPAFIAAIYLLLLLITNFKILFSIFREEISFSKKLALTWLVPFSKNVSKKYLVMGSKFRKYLFLFLIFSIIFLVLGFLAAGL